MLRFFRQYYPIRNLVFVFGEGLLIYLAVLLASMFMLGGAAFYHDKWLVLKGLLITFVCQICIYYNDLYDMKVTSTYSELGIRLCQALGVAAIFLAGVYFLFPSTIIGQGVYLTSTGIVLLLIALWRFGYTVILDRGLFNESIIVLGSGELAMNIISEIGEKKDCGYNVAVAIPIRDGRTSEPMFINGNAPRVDVAAPGDLCSMAKALNIKKIVVAIRQRRGAFPTKELLRCRVEGFSIIEGYSFYEMLTGKLLVEQINPAWLIFSRGFQKTASRRFFKRMLDVVLSLVLLIVLAPFFGLVALAIKLDSKGPVLFSQERVGEKRNPYIVHKFRSMVVNAEEVSGPVWASDNDPRVTRVGRIIRKTRIDEFPQLWNVLRGDMSFVGPRPERKYFVDMLDETIPYYGERFTVKPGITGWAQVSYGYGATVDDAREKLSYDLFYTKNFSLFMDLMIIMRTVKIVLFGKGAR